MADPSQSLRLTAAVNLVSFTSIKGAFFGMGFMLYCMCVAVFFDDFRKRRRSWRQTAFSFGYCSLIVSCALTDLATNTEAIVWAFVEHDGSTQDALASVTAWEANSSELLVWKGIAPILLVSLPSLMQIWRIWIIWTASPYAFFAISLPLLTWLCALAFAIFNIYHLFTSPDHAPFKVYAYFGLCTAFNVLVSLLVVGRLTLVRRRVAKIIGPTFEHSSQFTNIAAIFIESYALIAASYLTVSISAAVTDLEDPVRLLFLSINAQMEMIGYLLAFYRVLSGRAWTKETAFQLSRIQSNDGNGDNSSAMTGQSADGTNGSSQAPKTAILASCSISRATFQPASGV